MFKKAGEYMKEAGADFLITGEVLGERPMSQRKDAIRIIERDSGLKGLVLRPLSAKLFEPTVPEKTGIINREAFLSIRGRSRKPQIQLADSLGINDYPCPAGGCLLTDSGFANRMKDLIRYKPDFTINDVQLLKLGRQFRLTPEAKLIVGRNQDENNRLQNLAKDGDLYFYPSEVRGPTGIGKGIFNNNCLSIASSIVARYSDGEFNEQIKVLYRQMPKKDIAFVTQSPLEAGDLEKIRI